MVQFVFFFFLGNKWFKVMQIERVWTESLISCMKYGGTVKE